MQAVDQSSVSPPDDVLLFDGDQAQGLPQPGTFRCCPLGLQIFNRRALPLFELVEFTLQFPGVDGAEDTVVRGTGLVVDCRHDANTGLFHVHVKFLDLPDEVYQQLQATPRAMEHLCPYCENF